MILFFFGMRVDLFVSTSHKWLQVALYMSCDSRYTYCIPVVCQWLSPMFMPNCSCFWFSCGMLLLVVAIGYRWLVVLVVNMALTRQVLWIEDDHDLAVFVRRLGTPLVLLPVVFIFILQVLLGGRDSISSNRSDSNSRRPKIVDVFMFPAVALDEYFMKLCESHFWSCVCNQSWHIDSTLVCLLMK